MIFHCSKKTEKCTQRTQHWRKFWNTNQDTFEERIVRASQKLHWAHEQLVEDPEKKFHQILPSMVDGCNVTFFPLLQIEDVHAISPATCVRIKVSCNVWVWEIQILVETMETFSTGFNSSVYISFKIHQPEWREILPDDDMTIQEKDPVWGKLRVDRISND